MPQEDPTPKHSQVERNSPASASFTWSARWRSFRYAGLGIAHAFRVTHNFWIHAAIATAVVALAAWLDLPRQDWAILILCIALVVAMEVINTAVEELVDLLHPAHSPAAGRIKDLTAGAVLLAAIGAAVAGLLILGPPLWARLFGG